MHTGEDRITEFLKESNAIEGVYDSVSLGDSVSAWDFLSKQIKLDIPTILKTHALLMKNQPIDSSEKGKFRKRGVMIGARYGITPVIIPEMISNWTKIANDRYSDKEKIKRAHILYEEIHPFIDGNGRTGRMFMNWQRIICGYPIKIIHEKDKHEYYSWFSI
jgi:Fic family protein